MDLPSLVKWAQESANIEYVRQYVRRDPKDPSQPREGDVMICISLIKEIGNRAQMVIEHTKKANRHMEDISGFLKTLGTKGTFDLPGENKKAKEKEPEGNESEEDGTEKRKSRGFGR